MNTININNEEFKVKATVRSMIFMERNAKKHKIKENGFEQQVIMLFSTLQANNRDTFKLNYDEFLDVLDDNPEILSNSLGAIEAKDDSVIDEDELKK